MRGVDLSPCLDYGENLLRVEVGEGDIVRGRECENVAFACDWSCAEKEGRKICSLHISPAPKRSKFQSTHLSTLPAGYILLVLP